MGDLELKGLPEPVPTVMVVWEPSAEDADGAHLPGRLASTAASGLFGFSGRGVELERLVEAQKRSVSEARLQVVLIAGEPGVGKTSLAAHAARKAHGEGVTVLFGACPEGTSAPYQPWISALSHLVRHCPAEVLSGLTRSTPGPFVACCRPMAHCCRREPLSRQTPTPSNTCLWMQQRICSNMHLHMLRFSPSLMTSTGRTRPAWRCFAT